MIRLVERVLNVFLEAVEESNHPFLSTDLLPTTDAERQKFAGEWAKRSRAFGIFDGCLGAIDGWLCTIEKPSDVNNPSDYFSGHMV